MLARETLHFGVAQSSISKSSAMSVVQLLMMGFSLSSFHFGRPFRIDSEEITVQNPDQYFTTASSGNHLMVLKEWVFLSETLVPVIRTL